MLVYATVVEKNNYRDTAHLLFKFLHVLGEVIG
jgi:hypothetical protein